MRHASRREIFQILRRCEIFLGLHDEDLEKIAALPSIRLGTCEAGETILEEGEPAHHLHILVEGRVDIRTSLRIEPDGENQEIIIDTVTRGGVFGSSALVRPYILQRSFHCVDRSTVLLISGPELLELMEKHPRMGYEIMQNIASVLVTRLMVPNKYYWAELLRKRSRA